MSLAIYFIAASVVVSETVGAFSPQLTRFITTRSVTNAIASIAASSQTVMLRSHSVPTLLATSAYTLARNL